MNLLVIVFLAIILLLLASLIFRKNRSFSANKKTYIALPIVLAIGAIGAFTPIGDFFSFLLTVSASLVLAPAALVALVVFLILMFVFLFREKSRAFSKNKAYYLCIIIAFLLLLADVAYLVTAPSTPISQSAVPEPAQTESVQAGLDISG